MQWQAPIIHSAHEIAVAFQHRGRGGRVSLSNRGEEYIHLLRRRRLCESGDNVKSQMQGDKDNDSGFRKNGSFAPSHAEILTKISSLATKELLAI